MADGPRPARKRAAMFDVVGGIDTVARTTVRDFAPSDRSAEATVGTLKMPAMTTTAVAAVEAVVARRERLVGRIFEAIDRHRVRIEAICNAPCQCRHFFVCRHASRSMGLAR